MERVIRNPVEDSTEQNKWLKVKNNWRHIRRENLKTGCPGAEWKVHVGVWNGAWKIMLGSIYELNCRSVLNRCPSSYRRCEGVTSVKVASYGRWRLRGESKGELQAMADGAQSVEESREESWEELEDQMWRDDTRWVRRMRPESRRCNEF
ncbi:hypothetical protein SLEP1_g10859 [Rubroshorea leprosula]|uniref:Uncharacterized protein n=1 Tax=Rubroshorea leprosula TaxID=152421 RepID=A0AAV5IFC8_9ROSI|nr:hypothetical protein SLEP1_g10859 [Rubroshorea leprosula]